MNSIKDGIFGSAVGDALGVPIEFTARVSDKSKKLRDMVGYGSHHVPAGTWSDDTSMTLATLDSIQEKKGIDYTDIMNKFIEWYDNAKYTATDEVFDIGNATASALYSYKSSNIAPIECGGKSERSNGNGSLMRFLPIAEYLSYSNLPEAEEVQIVKNSSALTHGHEISMLGCYIYTVFIKSLNKGNDKYQAYRDVCSSDYSKYFSQETISKYSRILDGNLDKLYEMDIKSSGYVISTLEASLWCTLKTDSYEESIVEAINLGSDTDTVGAVTGSITGKIYGYDNIPDRWISKLRKADYLEELCNKFDNKIILSQQDISL